MTFMKVRIVNIRVKTSGEIAEVVTEPPMSTNSDFKESLFIRGLAESLSDKALLSDWAHRGAYDTWTFKFEGFHFDVECNPKRITLTEDKIVN